MDTPDYFHLYIFPSVFHVDENRTPLYRRHDWCIGCESPGALCMDPVSALDHFVLQAWKRAVSSDGDHAMF